jgi:hypothetical protein
MDAGIKEVCPPPQTLLSTVSDTEYICHLIHVYCLETRIRWG